MAAPPRNAVRALATFALILAAGSRLDCKSEAPKKATLALSPCRPKGVSEEVRCGVLEVPEDRSKPNGRQIPLQIDVVPALAGKPQPDAVFVLAGGPGQAAAELVGAVLPMIQRLHRNRDIVFVDQRGTGKSSPLECPDTEDAGLAAQFDIAVNTGALHACLSRYQKEGIDVRQYLTPQAMDDLDAVRAALGYDKIDLWGVSYGTRAGMVYLRRHGDHVRTAVRDSVAPPMDSLLLTTAEDGQRAFDLIFDACAQDAACNKTYPDLKKQFDALLARLDKEPAHVRVNDPITGAPTDLVLTRESFVTNLHGLLYEPEISALMPLIIQRASQGDFSPFVAQAVGMSNGIAGGIAQGMFFSIICAEDAPAATPEARKLHNRPELFFGDTFANNMAQVCAFWPRGELPAEYHNLVKSDAPVLLLSGELDPVTPPARAKEAAAGFPNGLQITVPGVGHGVTQQGCMPDVVAQFVESGDVHAIDAGCVSTLARPPFFVSFAGPSP